MAKTIKSIIVMLSVAYFMAICSVLTIPLWPREAYWLTTLFFMSPIWIILVPPVALCAISIAARSWASLAINMIAISLVFFFVMDFNIPDPGRLGRSGLASKSIRVVSCNLGTRLDERKFASFVKSAAPDIIVFQEAYARYGNMMAELFPPGEWHRHFEHNLGIVSRFEIKDVEEVNRNIVGGWGGLAARYDIATDGGTVRLFNIHMDTPREGIQAVLDDKIGGIPELRKGAGTQEAEFGIVAGWVRRDRDIIVAGDFNMPVGDPIYRKSWSWLQNAFDKAGLGLGYTKFTRWHGVRIDHILCDESWAVARAYVGPNAGSDHRPVVADLIRVRAGAPVAQVVPRADRTASRASGGSFIFEEFETSLGRLSRSSTAEMVIDAVNTYRQGNAVKIGPKAGAGEGGFKISTGQWRVKDFPFVRFSYMIPSGIKVDLRVRTSYGDWLYLAGTDTGDLIADGKWRDADIDANSVVSARLPGVKYLETVEFRFDSNGSHQNSFWIDEFMIGAAHGIGNSMESGRI